MRTGEHGMSVKKACGALGVSRGGYYAFLNRPKSSRQIAREALEPFVEDIFCANNRRYGSRRIVVELRKIGIVANDKTAQRMMARKGLVSCRGPKKYRRGGKASDKGANVLNRERRGVDPRDARGEGGRGRVTPSEIAAVRCVLESCAAELDEAWSLA